MTWEAPCRGQFVSVWLTDRESDVWVNAVRNEPYCPVSNVIPLNPGTGPLRILVVDDHLDGVHALVKFFELEGHVASFAINGFAALEAAREFKPDVIILDMTGLDVARQLKFEAGMENLRIIAMSGSPEFRAMAAEHGITEFVLKPVETGAWKALLSGEGAKPASNDAAGR